MVGYLNAVTDMSGEPVSRTHQYRKVMKPLLERKRRARINRCLDELKDLMTSTFQAEGENVAKLEKADILELTVRHLQKIQKQKPSSSTYVDKFKDGFRQCADEVTQFLDHTVGPDSADATTRQMLQHMQSCVAHLERLPGAGQNGGAPPSLAAAAAEYANSMSSQSLGGDDDEPLSDEEAEYAEYEEAQQAKQLAQQQQQQQQFEAHKAQLLMQQQHQQQQLELEKQRQQQLWQHQHMQQLQQLHEMQQQHRSITPPHSPAVQNNAGQEVHVNVDEEEEEEAQPEPEPEQQPQPPPKKRKCYAPVSPVAQQVAPKEDAKGSAWRPW